MGQIANSMLLSAITKLKMKLKDKKADKKNSPKSPSQKGQGKSR